MHTDGVVGWRNRREAGASSPSRPLRTDRLGLAHAPGACRQWGGATGISVTSGVAAVAALCGRRATGRRAPSRLAGAGPAGSRLRCRSTAAVSSVAGPPASRHRDVGRNAADHLNLGEGVPERQ